MAGKETMGGCDSKGRWTIGRQWLRGAPVPHPQGTAAGGATSRCWRIWP